MDTTVTLSFDGASGDAFCRCVRSLGKAFSRLGDLGFDVSEQLAVVDDNIGDLAAFSADGTRVSLKPSDRLLRVVAAVLAVDPEVHAVEVDLHGFPILSRVDLAIDTMTDPAVSRNRDAAGEVA